MILTDTLLGENMRIKRDYHNWIIQRLSHKTKGNDIWQSEHFCSTLPNALRKIFDLKLSDNDTNMSLYEYLTEIRKVEGSIQSLLAQFEVRNAPIGDNVKQAVPASLN